MKKILLLLVGIVLLGASTTYADEVDELLAQADKLFNELEYQKAIGIADQILQTPNVAPEKIVEAYRIKGLSLSGDDRIDDAFMIFRRLLAIDPSYRLSKDVSPRLAAPFYQAAAIAGEEGVVELVHIEPTNISSLAGLKLSCHLKSNPYNLVYQVRMRYRTPANDVTGELKADTDGKKGPVEFEIPKDIKAKALLYHFEALNKYGGVLGRAGSGSHPFRVMASEGTAVAAKDESADGSTKEDQAATAATTPAPDGLRDDGDEQDSGKAPYWKTWWFWTAVGGGVAVIAGTAIGISMASGGSDTYTYQIKAGIE